MPSLLQFAKNLLRLPVFDPSNKFDEIVFSFRLKMLFVCSLAAEKNRIMSHEHFRHKIIIIYNIPLILLGKTSSPISLFPIIFR